MKRDSIEADSTFSTWFKRKTSHESEHIHCKECTETEDISLTAQQAVTYTEKHTSFNENHIISKCDKRRNSNKRVMIQKWSVVTLQEMRSHD